MLPPASPPSSLQWRMSGESWFVSGVGLCDSLVSQLLIPAQHSPPPPLPPSSHTIYYILLSPPAMCVLCISKSKVEKYYTTDSDYYLGKYLWVDWKIFEYVWTVTGWLELVSSVRVTAGDQHRWLTSQHSFASIIIDLTPVTSDRKYLMWVCVRCGSVSSLGLHWWSPIKSVSGGAGAACCL